jgi:cell division protein FtsQ
MKRLLQSFWQSPRALNVLAGLLAAVAVLLAVYAAMQGLGRLKAFNIKEVVVTGMRGEQDLMHQNPAFIKQAIVRQLRGNLLTVKLDVVQSTFAQAPWIRHVSVRRVWPNRLWVVLEEHQAVATLNDDYLINQQGEAFMAVADGAQSLLPGFVGDLKDAGLMLARYKELNDWLAPSQTKADKLILSERRAWTVVLSNQITLEIGRDDLQPSAQKRVQRWARTWSTAQQVASSPQSKRVDLRYPNGYAISRSAY